MSTKEELDAMLEKLRNPSVPAKKSRKDSSAENQNSVTSAAETTISAQPASADVSAKTAAEKSKSAKPSARKPKKKSGFVASLEKILEEDPDSIADERSEKTEPDDPEDSARRSGSGKLKRRIYAFFGVVFTLFAVVGMVASVKFGVRYFHSFTSGEEKKSDFTDVIYPAVIMDIGEFESPSALSSEQIISAALWSLVMSADDMEKYGKTFDVISVPAIDVESYAARLFGESLPSLTHATVGSGELKFYYNEEAKSYNVPVNPVTFTYVPEITSVSKSGSEYTLVVDYLSEIPSWMERSDNFSREVSKTVEFKLHESGDSYTISSMRVIAVHSAL